MTLPLTDLALFAGLYEGGTWIDIASDSKRYRVEWHERRQLY